MRRLLVAGVAAGLVTLVLFVGNRTSRHPGLTTRRLSDDADRHAVDACEYCERLTRDWEKRVCRILSSGAEDHSFFAGYFSGIPATATRKPRYECANGRFVSFRRLDVLRVNRVLAKCDIPACGAVQAVIDNCPGRTPDFLPLLPDGSWTAARGSPRSSSTSSSSFLSCPAGDRHPPPRRSSHTNKFIRPPPQQACPARPR